MDLGRKNQLNNQNDSSEVNQLPEGQVLQRTRENDLSARLRTLESKLREVKDTQESVRKMEQWLSSQQGELNRQRQQLLKQQQQMQRQDKDKENSTDVKVQRPRGVRGGKNKRRDYVKNLQSVKLSEYIKKRMEEAIEATITAGSRNKEAEGRQQ